VYSYDSAVDEVMVKAMLAKPITQNAASSKYVL
jgi:hypothetical protein